LVYVAVTLGTVTEFHQNRSMVKGRRTGQRHTDRQTDRQTDKLS